MEEVLANVAPLVAGEMLDGKYRVVRQMGEGGMGIVYEAHHPLLQKTVAIKVLRPELAKMEERRDRFEAEARATAAIGHPNIVAVNDMGETADGALYFVMDRLNGETLAERIQHLKKLDIRSAAVIALDVLSGLEAAHALMLIHRDLKPDNIFMARSPGAGDRQDPGFRHRQGARRCGKAQGEDAARVHRRDADVHGARAGPGGREHRRPRRSPGPWGSSSTR